MATSTVMRKLAMATAGAAVALTSIAVDVTPVKAIALYTDRAAFTAATQSLQNIDFEGIAGPADWFKPYPSGLTISGVNFTSSNNSLFVVDPAYAPNYIDWKSGAFLDGDFNSAISAEFTPGVTAVGSDIMSYDLYGAEFLITLSGGQQYTVNSLSYPNRGFVGFTSEIAITSISYRAKATATYVDNFTFGQAIPVPHPENPTSVPEPTSILGLLAFGALGAGSMVKRKSY